MYASIPVVLSTLAGALLGSVAGCLPGVHVCSGVALLAAWAGPGGPAPFAAGPSWLTPFAVAFIVAHAMLNTLPAIWFGAPDESALPTVAPGQAERARGHAHAAVLMTTRGGLAGLFVLVFLAGPLIPRFLPAIRRTLTPHTSWVLWCLSAFFLLSEPPGETMGAGSRRQAVCAACLPRLAGWLTFLASGLLGFLLLCAAPTAWDKPYRSLLPAVIGLFALPLPLVHLVWPPRVPRQAASSRHPHPRSMPVLGRRPWIKGTVAGVLGGGFAAFFFGVTGAAGALAAREAAVLRRREDQLVCAGASKMTYYAGSILLFCVPGYSPNVDGGLLLPAELAMPLACRNYGATLGMMALAGTVSFLLVGPLSRLAAALIHSTDYRIVLTGVILVIGGAVATQYGLYGFMSMIVGAGIGLVPVLFGARRENGLGVVLLPAACALSGWGSCVAEGLGLL